MPDEEELNDMGWDDINTGGFEVLPAGRYPVRVVALDATVASTGTEMWKGQFEVTEGDYEGRYLWQNLMVDANLKPGAMGRTKGLVVATNTKFPKGLSLKEAVDMLNQMRTDLIGQECIAVVGQSMYNGEPSNEIKRFMPLT